MTSPDFKNIYAKELDAELCAGYYYGSRKSTPEPTNKDHPAYIHGFLNGRDDLNHRPRKTAQELRETWAYIEAVFS
jgi:hypothetical protein